MAGVPVLNEDLVNLPNWLLLELRIEEEAVGTDNVEAALLPPRVRRSQRPGRAQRIRDRSGRGPRSRPALREHGRHAPGGRRWTIAQKTGRAGGDDLRAGRQGRAGGVHPLPEPRRPPPRPGLAEDIRARDHRPGVRTLESPSTSPRRPAPASTTTKDRSTRIATSTRCRTTSTRCSPSRSRRRSPCTSRRWSPSTPRATTP